MATMRQEELLTVLGENVVPPFVYPITHFLLDRAPCHEAKVVTEAVPGNPLVPHCGLARTLP